ncbi:unnamed protein product [Brassicogethes aeneus]|uniref:Hemolymph juvenile hormone binding protein n=1 Tax=Brassicogethes aeneus TaxID=1431903 RepID=A0A9P0B9U8_BRAAE|nr:unnamed protein product [Brassicogethes aeneus]
MWKRCLFVLCSALFVKCQVDLASENYFGKCLPHTIKFDGCIKDVINDLRPHYPTGLPDYGILPLDPFHAAEVPQKRSGPFFNYKLILRNVTESGWTQSQITRFRSDLNKNLVQYTQFFPDKRLKGSYEISGEFFGQKVQNQGSWDLRLIDYTQTTTATRKPIRDSRDVEVENPPIKAKIQIQTCKKLELHIGNLAGGRTIFENMLDWIINTAWQPGFVMLSPLINDLVSTAFTEIFNKDFQHFPFEQVFKNNV